MTAAKWVFDTWQRVLPQSRPASIVEWARANVRLIGSVLSEAYDPDITPWTKAPIEATDDGYTRRGTFVKPIQCGGSEVGTVGILFRIATSSGGDIQYNWPNDAKAKDKWDKAIERKIRACPAVMQRVGNLDTWKKGLITFPHLNLTVQGVLSATALTSDPITFQVNEELHDEDGGWLPGRLEQAHGRLTAVWNGVAFQISNAGRAGGELEAAFEAGTKEYWEVPCPGCRQFHRLRTRWNDKHPELGGLRYDSAGCTLANGHYDYTKMLSSIRLQMPCGFPVYEDKILRRSLSMGGRYGQPTNTGAPRSQRSWTLEAVSVDYIPFLSLIQQKHKALRSLKYGDADPWWTYLRERECQFASDDARPMVNEIVLTDRVKDRAGIKDRIARYAAVDRQQGEAKAGELPHWWLLIVDVEILPSGVVHLLLIFEGKMLTDTDLVQTIKRHELMPSCVVVDSGWDTTHVYGLCLEHGWSAIKGEGRAPFSHPDGSRKIFSVEKPICEMINRPYSFPRVFDPRKKEWVPDPREPIFWHYLKAGIMERVEWMRAQDAKVRAANPDDPGIVMLDIPEDVSDDFKQHMNSWELTTKKSKQTNEEVPIFRQVRARDDLYQCFGYIAMLCEMACLIGSGAPDRSPEGQAEVAAVHDTLKTVLEFLNGEASGQHPAG